MAERPVRTLTFLVVVVWVLVGCVVNQTAGGGSAPSQDAAAPTLPQATETIAASPSPDVTASPEAEATALPHVPSTCHLTKPTHPFVPPGGYPAPARPPTPDEEWYGSARLWMLLSRNGEVWIGLPRGTDSSFGQKTFWWSADFDVNHEPQPGITVTGRQLDGRGRFSSPAPGTNAQSDFGSAMLTGVDIPSTGCWQITATYRRATLSFVVWVG